MQQTISSSRVEFFVDLSGYRSVPASDYFTDYIQKESTASLSDHAHLDTVVQLKLGERSWVFAVMADCGLCLWPERSRAERTMALCGD